MDEHHAGFFRVTNRARDEHGKVPQIFHTKNKQQACTMFLARISHYVKVSRTVRSRTPPAIALLIILNKWTNII